MGIIESKWWTFNLCISSLTHVLSWTEHIHFTGYKCIWPRLSTRAHQSDIQSIDLNIHAINTSNHHQMAGMVVFSSRFSRAAKFDASATINFGHSIRFWCKQCTDIQNDCFYFIWLFWKGIIDTVFYPLDFVVFSLKCIPIKGLFEIVFVSPVVDLILFRLNVIKMIFNWFHFTLTFLHKTERINVKLKWVMWCDGHATDR